jgi:hypothetical protein
MATNVVALTQPTNLSDIGTMSKALDARDECRHCSMLALSASTQ